MNTKTFMVWFLLFAAVVLAVAAESSVDNKKQGDKQVETPTVEGKNDATDSLNQGDVGVEEEDNNYEVDPERWGGGGGHGGGWRGGGGHGGGWRGGGGHGGGWRGGGGHGGGWRGGGGGGGWRGGGGGFDAELTTKEVNDEPSDDISQDVQWRGGGGGWRGGGGHGGGWRGGGGHGGWRGGGGGWRGGGGGWRGGGGGYRGGGGGWRGGGGGW